MAARTEESLETILAEMRALARRVETLERELADAPPAEAAPPSPLPAVAPEGEMREDTFGPAVHRSSSSGHLNSVNKALSMLGLVPEKQAEPEQAHAESQRHKAAVSKALEVLGISREPEPEPEPGIEPLDDLALEDEEIEEVVEKPAPGDIVPLPEIQSRRRRERIAAAAAPVDLETAVPVDLARARGGARDYALPILNVGVLLGVVGAALYTSGALEPGALHGAALSRVAAGAGALLFGALALFLRRASSHVRAALAGAAAFHLQALALLEVSGRLPMDPAFAALFFAGASLLGTWLVLQTAHPLGLFLGGGAALLLPIWLAPAAEVYLPFIVVTNLSVGYAALRLQRLQASIFALLTTSVLLVVAGPSLPFLHATLLSLAWLAQGALAPRWHRRPVRSAAALALIGCALFGWAVHVRCEAGGIAKAGMLFGVGTLCALFAARVHRREEMLRGALKACAVLLLLSALPIGFPRAALPYVALLIALLFGVFARLLVDPYLRAAGALVWIVAGAMILVESSPPPLAFVAAAVAALLYSARGHASDSLPLTLLLGGLAHGAFLYGVALLAPPELLAYGWAAVGVACAAAGNRLKLPLLESGAALAVGAAAFVAVSGEPADPMRIGLVAFAVATLHFFAPDPRRAGLYLLVAELLLLAAVFIGLPGPRGVLASLPLLALVAAPWWRGELRATLHTHARFLALVVLGRCLLPDLLELPVAAAWLNERTAAYAAAALAGGVLARRGGPGAGAAAALASAVVGALVWSETAIPFAGITAFVFCFATTWWLLPTATSSPRAS